MSLRRIASITDVAEQRLCSGCGVCASVQPDDIEMVDVLDEGRRPIVAKVGGIEPATAAALAACPGIELGHPTRQAPPGTIAELYPGWGPVLELWEGYAADDELRFAASSGGAASALALECIENLGMYGALHVAARHDVPYLNETRLSRTRAELLAATGSRYAPASPGDRLRLIEEAPAPCVFLGKPCDVAGVAKARRQRAALDDKIGLTIAMFCAGTPSTRGTFEMMKTMGIDDPSLVKSVRYRGNGWPGRATVDARDGEGGDVHAELSYDESWGEILQRHRQWRCHVCADHTGEFADVAVGDPWYREIPPGEPGRSLVVVRTERGRRAVEEARSSGRLVLERVAPDVLVRSQPWLLRTRGAIWGRMLTTRVMGVATPRYRNLSTFRFWLQLSTRQKLQSIGGTARRVKRKDLRHRVEITPFTPERDIH